jgi:hypothetical protein
VSYTLNETKYNSPNYTPAGAVAATYGMARTIRGVTIHHWGVDGQSIDGISSYLCRPGGNTSAHFSLQDGLVYCLVSPEDAAWHAGSAEGNATTIGIECRPEMTDGDLRTLVEFIQWLESVYGSLNIYRHQDWSSTECPGRYAGQIDWIVDQVNAGSTPASPSTGGGSMEAAIGWFEARAGQVTYSMDYRNGPSSYDCSSSVYYALAAAGINTSGKVGNTENHVLGSARVGIPGGLLDRDQLGWRAVVPVPTRRCRDLGSTGSQRRGLRSHNDHGQRRRDDPLQCRLQHDQHH